MSARLDELAIELGVNIQAVLVTFATPERLDEYQQRRDLAMPILIDPDRSAYSSYGLPRGSISAVWGLATLTRYWHILRPSGPGSASDYAAATEDTRQLGGDMVIASNGTLVWGHWSTGPADRPAVDDLIDALRTAHRHE
ncbi:MAG: AhpC/TSA family protein [Ilumatobacter sp.]